MSLSANSSNNGQSISNAVNDVLTGLMNETKQNIVDAVRREEKIITEGKNDISEIVQIRARLGVLMKKLEMTKRRDITRFVDAHRHKTHTTSVDHMKWTAEAMELVTNTKLANEEKREFVTLLYKDLAEDETNTFTDDFDIGDAVEFIWDASQQRFGVKLRRKGCFKYCFPCCKDVSVVADVDDGKVDVKMN